MNQSLAGGVEDVRLARCRALLEPRTIAVVGASERPGPGQRVLANLLRIGFDGQVWPVNPKHERVLGVPAFSTLSALPDAPDLVVLAVNREVAATATAEAVEMGAAATILLGAGFGETDGRGQELNLQLRALTASIAMMGPNCLGFVNLQKGAAPYSGPLMESLDPGNVALVSNSGALACTLTGACAERGLRFSHVITTGNQIDLSTADYVRYLAHCSDVRVIACYLEGFTDGRALLSAFAEARASGKLVVLLKSGRSAVGGEAARTHTGAIAGSAAVQDALWRDAGLLVANDLEDFLALMELGSRATAPSGPRLGVITISGGERLMLADQAEAAGMELASLSEATLAALGEILPAYATPSNPLDSTGAGLVERDGRAHAEAARILALDPAVDLLLVCQDIKNGWVQSDRSATLFWDAIRAAWEGSAPVEKPIVVLSPTTGQIDERAREYLQEYGIPMLLGLTPGMRALAQFITYHCGPTPSRRTAQPVSMGTGEGLTGHDALRYLADHGVPVARTEMAHSEDEAVAAAERMGYPVTLKIDAPGLLHRSELRGVRLDLHGGVEVRAAWRELSAVPAWDRTPVSIQVQAMVRGGVELLVGGMRDEQFGPVILAGAGGTLAELVHDVGVGLAPLTEDGAARLIAGTRVSQLLAGWRGAPAADLAAVLQALVAISRVVAQPQVKALDANPLIALPTGVVLVDAKLVLRESPEAESDAAGEWEAVEVALGMVADGREENR